MSQADEIRALCDEVAFHRGKALQWKKAAVEERERYDRLRDAAQAVVDARSINEDWIAIAALRAVLEAK